MVYAEVAKLEHSKDCLWNREDSCDCGAVERHLSDRVEKLETILRKFLQAGVGNSIDLQAHHEAYSETMEVVAGCPTKAELMRDSNR